MADDVLILQPFELEVFQQGIPQQAELLLNYIGLENKVRPEVKVTPASSTAIHYWAITARLHTRWIGQ